MSDTLDARVARLEEAIIALKEDRIESRSDRKDTLSKLDQVRADVQSTANVISGLSLGKLREDVERHGTEVAALKAKLGVYEKILGSGAGLIARVIGSLIVAALMGGFGYAVASGHIHFG